MGNARLSLRFWKTVILGAALGLVAAATGHAEDTLLRHDNYLAFTGKPGETARFDVKALPRAPYQEDTQLLVLDSDSQQVAEQMVPVGTQTVFAVPLQREGLHVLAVSTGQCLATVRRAEAPYALVAWEQAPLNICGSMAKQYFMVPRGLTKFELGVSASVTTEGARLGVWGPDGQSVVDLESDFDQEQRVKVDVPAGMDGQVWALTLTKPQDPKLFLDDVQLWLGRGLPPYLCEQPEWLKGFVADLKPEQISLRVPLKPVGLTAGGQVTITFTLQVLPQARRVVLRGMASDVDYPTEGTFTLNGSEPYAVPVTGDGATVVVTIPLRAGDLKVGENVLVFTHDNRGSNTMGLRDAEVLAGDVIHEDETW